MSIQICKDTVVVNGGYFIKHDYYFHRIPQLIEALYRIQHELENKILKICFLDGEPIRRTGIETLLSTLATEFNLSKSRFVIETVDKDFSSHVATVKNFTSPNWKICNTIFNSWVEQQLDNDAMLFGATFGRFTIERFLLAAFLGQKYSDKSFLIFQPASDLINFEFQNLEHFFKEELDWYQNYQRP
jgi:hypothetical protein